jgi:two-component system, chemotaxis family, response regulator Rcp1
MRRHLLTNSVQPDLILLDLNLPKKDGREVLAEIKADEQLMKTPVVVLTTSAAEEDIARAHSRHANCYITKPVDLDQFLRVAQSIESFWLSLVKLPLH